ncbi:MAG: M3 family metallopeptidase [Bacteroidales bacterium]|nr:M3 family metallopeptidase [Bacteroidales bacterium]
MKSTKNRNRAISVFSAALLLLTATSCNSSKMNPLLTSSDAPYGAPAFDKIELSHYKPAIEEAIRLSKENIDAITSNPAEPDFENTIEALEFSGEKLDGITSIFFNLNECCTSDKMQALAEELSPMLVEYSMYVSLNAPLFERVKQVYEKRETLGLDQEQARLLEETYKGFARSGANLSDEDKQVYSSVQEELSLAGLKFGQNSLAATNAYTLSITDTAQLAGLPEYVREMGAEEARSRGVEGWVFTLNAPSYGPFMRFSANRGLREQMWRKSNSKCVEGDLDNSENIRKIVGLREQSARLLGYENYAAYALEERMAKSAATVNSFLADLMEKSLPYARRDVAAIVEFAKENGFEGEFMPWDFSYWSEKLQEARYALNEEMLKPYFELANVRRAVLGLATTLYGITFTERKDIPVYHPDVVVYEVAEGDRFMGLLYMDFFPRDNKRAGAWMTEFRGVGTRDGNEARGFISLVTNFTKPTATTPSLLTFDELTTLLHEFGHALHGLLAEGRYGSLTGTSVTRDFVELPSQIMENWAYEPEYLKSFATHYQTGEVIPDELIEKIVAAKNYNAGYASVRQLQFGTLDMAWHSGNELPDCSVVDFEHNTLAPSAVVPQVEGCAMSPAFGHIFSGGYAAGYYSYKWAEVLDADAFSLFKEKGIFDRETAMSFRENILAKGNLEDADVLYRRFRGRDPRPEALLEREGMITAE